MIIAIDDYPKGPWNQLQTARKGAAALADVLKAQGYEIHTLYDGNATKASILNQGFGWLQQVSRRGDRVLVYFAGHGQTLRVTGSDTGYLVPFDGGADAANLISLSDLDERSKSIAAHHQLYVMDSCYSGLRWTGGAKLNPLEADYLAKIASNMAIEFVSAGQKDQEVADAGPLGYSLFTGALIQGLEGRADMNRDGVVTLSELGAYLDTCGSNRFQTPTIGSFSGQGNGAAGVAAVT